MKNDNQLKVSLVIPLYNVEKYIERSLLSALNQTFQNIEYILVDDKGTDNTIKIVNEIITFHPRKSAIKLISHSQNSGLGATRNTGIDNASGKYIIFMDSDDYLHSNAIELLSSAAENDNADLCIGSYSSIDFTKSGKTKEWKGTRSILIDYKNSIAAKYLKNGYPVESWNKLYNLQFLKKNNIRCIDNNNHEDLYFSFQVALNVKIVSIVPEITYIYSFREGSIMSSYQEKNYIDLAESLEHILIYSRNYRVNSIYSNIMYYIHGYRFFLLMLLLKSDTVTPEFKKSKLRTFGKSIIPFSDIWSLQNTKIMHKIKYSLTYLPPNYQAQSLAIIERIYSMKNAFKFDKMPG